MSRLSAARADGARETSGTPGGAWTQLGALALAWGSSTNLRTVLIAISPVLTLVSRSFHLSHSAAGALFSLPLLMMGAFAVPGGWLSDRFGPERVLAAALALLGVAGLARAASPNAPVLFISTATLGVAIGVAQPALPKFVRDRFVGGVGTATAVYSSGFAAGALLAAGLTVPVLLPLTGHSWRGPLFVWALPAVAIAFAWMWQPRRSAPSVRLEAHGIGAITRTRQFWLITTILFVNSALYYGINAWLVPFYRHAGWSLASASAPLTAFSIAGVVGGLALPLASDRWHSRRRPLFLGTAATLAGLLGLIVLPNTAADLWSALAGGGLVGIFTVTLTLPVDVAHRAQVGLYSGLVMTLAYVGGVLAPLFVGASVDAAGSYLPGWIAFAGLAGLAFLSVVALPETYGRSAEAINIGDAYAPRE